MDTSPVQILRVALYARVSTEEQREGQTIDSQVAELERFATEKGWHIIGIYKDEGWSGSLLARPELDRLRDDASKGAFDIVLLNDVDRLARDVSHLGIVKRDLERQGIQVIFKKLPSEKSPTYNLMVNILGSFAEFEREMISDRTRRGRRHKVEVRQQYLGCLASYGYRYIPKDSAANKEGYLQSIPEEAAMVRQMFEWVDKEGLSARKVVKRLTEIRVPTRKGDPHWAKSTVLRILRNETYAGVWYYNKHEGHEPIRRGKDNKYKRTLKSSLRLRARAEWLPVVLPDHLRIIERNLWERVQQQLTRNSTFSPRNAKHSYLLKGLIRCGACGARYIGDPNHGRFYYRCLDRCRKYSTIREEYLDNTVWDALKEAILNPSLITDQVETIQDRRAGNAEDLKLESNEIDGAIAQIQKEEERVLEAYRSGILSPSLLGRELEKINTRRSSLEARKAHLVDGVAKPKLPDIRKFLAAYCLMIAESLNSFGFEERQQFLRLLVNEVVYQGDTAIIRGVVPIHRVGENEQFGRKFNTNSSNGGYVGTGDYSRGRNSVISDDRVVGKEGYHRAPNTVLEVPFEFVRPITKIKPQQLIAA